MQKDITGHSVLFPNVSRRPVVAKFDQRHGSSDGGAILRKACDERLGLTQRLANCVVDPRQPGKIEHTIGDLVCALHILWAPRPRSSTRFLCWNPTD